jgi:hypothetical protein
MPKPIAREEQGIVPDSHLAHGAPMFPDQPVQDVDADEGDDEQASPFVEATRALTDVARGVNETARATREAIDSFIARGDRTQPPAARPEPVERPLGPPPSAAEDPEGFARWLDERDARRERAMRAEIAGVRSEITEQSQLTTMWHEIIADPSLAELEPLDNEDLFEAAFNRMVRENGGRLPNLPPRELKARVVASVRARIERLRGADDELDDTVTDPRATDTRARHNATRDASAPASRSRAQGRANRTAGLSGPSTHARRAAKPAKDDDGGSFLDEIAEAQGRTPYYAN